MLIVTKKYTHSKAEVVLLVEKEEAGLRLDEFAMGYLKSLSRESIKRMIRGGNISIISRQTKNAPHSRIVESDKVIIFYSNDNNFFDIKDTIVFESDDIVVINKPAGMLSHPTGRHLFNAASVLIEEYCNHKIYPVHRLDKETSGLLCFAKNSRVATKLRQLFDSNQIVKKYYFLTTVSNQNHLCEGFIEKNIDTDRQSTISLKQKIDNSGKKSKTIISDIDIFKDYILGVAYPVTGRLHQIRVHLASIGFPLIGDTIYNNEYSEEQYWHYINKGNQPELKLFCFYLEIPNFVSLKLEKPHHWPIGRQVDV